MGRTRADGKVSKRKMVEDAMAELGDVKPAQMREHILEKHQVDIPAQMISSYRSGLKRGTLGGAKPRPEGAPSPGPGRPRGSGGGAPEGSVTYRDLATIRDLIARHGVGELQSIIRVLGT